MTHRVISQAPCCANRKNRGIRRLSLTLHFHPLSSYCHKTLIALYENATPFTHLEAYFARLTTRPSYARVLKEAEPYFSMFPAS